MKTAVIIPIYHPDGRFNELLQSLQAQSWQDFDLWILDSGSADEYQPLLAGLRAKVQKIDPKQFNHGGTRRQAVEQIAADFYVFLTQDAVLHDIETLMKLLNIFQRDEKAGCVYGRQLPHSGAGIFGSYARSFNYGRQSYVRSQKDIPRYGIKTCFLSDSFAAYRRTALLAVGGFPSDAICSEDMYAAAKMVLAGWDVAYAADASVYHSHDYSIWQEFCRYFDTGTFHAREGWIRERFGKAEGEGKRFVLGEIKYILKHKPYLLFSMFIRDGMKFAGYRLGIMEKYLPIGLKKRISMNRNYWQ
jgi:rhamnosyltransferase